MKNKALNWATGRDTHSFGDGYEKFGIQAGTGTRNLQKISVRETRDVKHGLNRQFIQERQ